jgi:uncharacterized HAD superfamily protein
MRVQSGGCDYIMTISLEDFITRQKKFSDEFFDASKLSEEQKVERHKTFCLALHSEITQLADAVFYKDHRSNVTKTNRQKILFESIDVFRYFLATLNLWNFTSSDIEAAFDSRDAFLWDRKNRPLNAWAGQPVAVVDIDDVVAEFRKCFFDWINDRFKMSLSEDMPAYYYNGMCGNLTGEEAFMQFIDEGMLKGITVNKKMMQTLNVLKEKGYWVQLLTARPHDNLKCVYDTYSWLRENNVVYDNVAFSSEKYRWLADKPFFKRGAIKFAIDDSPKNASEYAHHGVQVYVPKRSYNDSVWGLSNLTTFDWNKDNLHEMID